MMFHAFTKNVLTLFEYAILSAFSTLEPLEILNMVKNKPLVFEPNEG